MSIMKKMMLALALVSLAVGVKAQETDIPRSRYSVSTNSFWANWYISAGGDFNAAYSSQEASGLSGNPFSSKRGTFGFDVSVGKWFTPGIGLRTKMEGVWAKQVNTENDHHAFTYWNLHEDVMFDVHNLLFGYKENRVWNLVPYVGLGVARNMSGRNYDFSYNAGLLNNFRVGKRVSLFLDVYATAVEGTFDAAAADGWAEHKKSHSRHWDKLVGASVGVTYRLGKHTWQKAPDVDALMAIHREQMEAMTLAMAELEEDNKRLRSEGKVTLPAYIPSEPAQVTEVVAPTLSVFFELGSSKIASRKDLVNLTELVNYAIENNRKVVVSGYADSRTGNADYNHQLSLRRAEMVAAELETMGVPRENIVVEAQGGVDTLTPYYYNRRATVKLQ
jgi:outer membrane protein OmpA-like peptidoglycan-associated protein